MKDLYRGRKIRLSIALKVFVPHGYSHFLSLLILFSLELGRQSKISSEHIFLTHIFQELVNDVKWEQISEELSGAGSTKWPQFYHAESKKLLGLLSKDPSFCNILGI